MGKNEKGFGLSNELEKLKEINNKYKKKVESLQDENDEL